MRMDDDAPDPLGPAETLAQLPGYAELQCQSNFSFLQGASHPEELTARAAELPVVAVDFGYSQAPVAEYSPDRLISHFAQLSEAIASLLPGK